MDYLELFLKIVTCSITVYYKENVTTKLFIMVRNCDYDDNDDNKNTFHYIQV